MESSNPPTLWTPEAISASLAEAARWEGTPHRNRMAKAGASGGIDCLHLVREILVAAGIVEPFRFPFYDPRWGIGRAVNIMARVMELCTTCTFHENTTEPEHGDVIIFRVGRQSNHVGIMLDGRLWHSQTNRIVEGVAYDEEQRQLVQTVARITQRGLKRRPETLTLEDFAPEPK